MRLTALFVLVGLSSLLSGSAHAQVADAAGGGAEGPRVAIVTDSRGFVHDVVKPVDGDSTVVTVLRDVVEDRLSGALTHISDASKIDFDNLDVVVFYTTGAIPLDVDALQSFVEAGGGMVGLHCAADTLADNEKYVALIGATFNGHPWNADDRVGLRSLDTGHAISKAVGGQRMLQEEMYQFREFDPAKVRTLIALDPVTTVKTPTEFVPVTWVKSVGEGRVVYSSLGHRLEVWQSRWYQDHLRASIGFAAGSIEGDTEPNPELAEREATRGRNAAEGEIRPGTGQADERSDAGDRPHDPWVFRCVLDQRPRTVIVALSDDVWAAWDATTCALYKVWPGGEEGGMNFTGTVYDTRHGPQPQTRGDAFDTFEGSSWQVMKDGEEIEVTPRWEGYAVRGTESVALGFSFALPGGEKVAVLEIPESAGPRSLRRRFEVSGLPEGMMLQTLLANGEGATIEAEGGTILTESRGQPVALLQIEANGNAVVTTTWKPKEEITDEQ